MKTQPRAFTLIEVMLAIAIFGMVLASIYATWSAILRCSKAGIAAAAEAQRTRIAIQALDQSLGGLQIFAGNMPYYYFFADTSQPFAALSFVARLPASFPGSGLFHGEPVRRVTFDVEPSDNSPASLVLKQTGLLEPADPSVEPYKIVLAPDVTEFKVEFWDPNPRVQDWVTEWFYTNQAPRLARVYLSFGDRQKGAGRELARVFDIHSITVPPAFQAPTFFGPAFGAGYTPGNISAPSVFNPFPDRQWPAPPTPGALPQRVGGGP